MKHVVPIAGIVLAAISCAQAPQWQLALSSSATVASTGGTTTIQIEAGATTIVHLLVIGNASNVTFTAERLPSFATLQGPDLTLSPARQDAGQYRVALAATDGSESQIIDVDVFVQRTNTAPHLWQVEFSDDTGSRQLFACPGPSTCTLQGPAILHVGASDAEGDQITVDVEVVPRGRPLTGV